MRAEETHLKVVVEPPGTGEIFDVSEDTIAAFSDDPEALFRLGNRYAIGNVEIAIKAYTRALEINTRYADAFNNRAVAYYNKEEYDKAWDDVHSAQGLGLQVHPKFLKALREASSK